MNSKKFLFLFLALLLPSFVFIFLKYFGRNQFDVPVLFVDALPYSTMECPSKYQLPYLIPDSMLTPVIQDDSVVFVIFGKSDKENIKTRINNRYIGEPVAGVLYDPEENSHLRQCIFILQEPFDMALVDRKGAIRGQYNSEKREEVDRLITEIAILINKY